MTSTTLGSHRLLPIVAAIAAVVAVAGCLWAAWCEFPFYAWNDVRLAPAFALRHGINPYPGENTGPLFTWIYGPVGIFINLPATWAPTALQALRTAFVINALVVLVPPAIIFLASRELRSRGALVPILAWLFTVLLLPRPNLVLQVADHAAIAGGLLACWCLARARQPGQAHLLMAAAFSALAVWSKQIAVFLIPAQIIYLWLNNGRSTAVRFTGWTALFGLLALALFIALFGFANLWLNLVAIPGRLPWAEFGSRLMMRPWSIFAQVLVPALLLLVIWRRGIWPSRDDESGRLFQILTLAAAAMLPVGLAAFFKIGGDTNLLHSWDYLLPALLVFWLSRAAASAFTSIQVAAVLVLGLGVRYGELRSLPARPFTAHYAAAAELMARHPHALWFPQNPVLTFYADGTLWHSEDGVLTRYAAGYGLREPDFRRYLPKALQGVVYPSIVEFPFSMPLLSEFNQTTRLPYWKLHSRAALSASLP